MSHIIEAHPPMSRIESVLHNLSSKIYLDPNSPRYLQCLALIVTTAKERPDLTHKVLKSVVPLFPEHWCAMVVDVLAPIGRTRIIADQMYAFTKCASDSFLCEKFHQWIQNPHFAKARIAKQLIWMSTEILLRFPTKKKWLRMLFNSVVVKSTAPQIGNWFAKMLLNVDESVLRDYCIRVRRAPVLAAALRETTVAKQLFLRDRFRASVRLAQFFRTLQKPTKILRSECMICWKTTVLYALHGDDRHAVCGRCRKGLAKNATHQCPMCRIEL